MTTTKSLWERLNDQMNLAGVQSLFSRKPNTNQDALDSMVDEIMEFATREARHRDKPLEEVLADFGFDLNVAEELQRSAEERSRATQGAAPGSKDEPGDGAMDEEEALAVVSEACHGVDPEELVGALERIAADGLVVRRLVFLGHLSEAAARGLRRGDGPIWVRLLEEGVSGEAVADAVLLEPELPPWVPGEDDFYEFALEQEVVRYRDWRSAERRAREGGRTVFEELMGSELVDADAWVEVIGRYAGMKPAKVPRSVGKRAFGALPIAWVEAFGVVPIRATRKTLTAIVARPLPEAVGERLEAVAGCTVVLQLATPEAVARLAEAHLAREAERRSKASGASRAKAAASGAPTSGSLSAAPVYDSESELRGVVVQPMEELRREVASISAVELVRRLFEGAVQARATDVHLEPMGDLARVRLRIDGLCHEVLTLPGGLFGEVVARIKILADMDITERRRAQDGHIRLELGGGVYDLRVATVPTSQGEKVGVRLADMGRVNIDLNTLGFAGEDLARLREVTSKPFGMVLATGPVGSGKTTTLYSCLNEVDRTRFQVMSVEDPVEIDLRGANQVEVNYAIGLDFAAGLRALLRQDPDTILIGEIRDEETARIAVRASMTGLMVYSTLHANDSVGAITTLRNFHISPHLIANSLQAVIAQRLVRKICARCRVPREVTEADARSLNLSELPEGFRAYRGEGCADCFQTGYAGRVGVFELFIVDARIREMIGDDAPTREVRRYAREHGLVTLQEDGLRKITDGVTTIDEFRRVLRF